MWTILRKREFFFSFSFCGRLMVCYAGMSRGLLEVMLDAGEVASLCYRCVHSNKFSFFMNLGLNCIRLPFNYHHFEGKYI